jgi:hypothetical protein
MGHGGCRHFLSIPLHCGVVDSANFHKQQNPRKKNDQFETRPTPLIFSNQKKSNLAKNATTRPARPQRRHLSALCHPPFWSGCFPTLGPSAWRSRDRRRTKRCHHCPCTPRRTAAICGQARRARRRCHDVRSVRFDFPCSRLLCADRGTSIDWNVCTDRFVGRQKRDCALYPCRGAQCRTGRTRATAL